MDLRKTLLALTLLLVPLIAEAQVTKTLLCIQKNSSVYYQLFKRGEEGDLEKWEVYLTVEHNAIENLYYVRSKEVSNPNMNMPVSLEDISPSAPYVTIRIDNAWETGPLADQKYLLYGKLTLHVNARGKPIFRVPNHNDHTFTVMVKKGEGPMISGTFNTALAPLDSLKAY